MNEKIIKVFFGSDCLPYKDKELQIHAPVQGRGAFLGASNSTKIRFYFDKIGDVNTTWVSVSKLPNGKQGSKVLPISSDEDGNYAELSLSNWYTQAKGDVVIALQGYQGGVEYSYDSETGLYEIHGTPTIQTTGCISLSINYAPIGDSPDYNDEFTTYQEILAALGDKANAIGELPHFNVNGTDNVLAFAQAHNKEAVVIKYLNTNFIGSFNITAGNYALFELESMYGNIRYSTNEFDAIDLTNLTFADIFSNTYMHNYQLLDNKVTSITSSSTNTQYPSAKAVYDLAQTKQDTLVSGQNIKTVNNQSLLGSGNINIQGGGGSAEWGSIGGDIADQEDLQEEFQNVREVAEGKTKTYVISYDAPVIIEETFIPNIYTRKDGSLIATYNDFLAYVGEYNTSCNNAFENDTKYPIDIAYTYFVTIDNEVIITRDMREGDIILVVELDVPDRWFSRALSSYAYPLETAKTDLTSYATKTELSTEVNKVAHNIALEYNENTLYGVGDLCIHDKKLYKCNTANTTGTWDSSKWDLTTVNSELGIIKGDIQHIANKFVGAYIGDETLFTTNMQVGDIVMENTGGQFLINDIAFIGTTLTKVVLVGLEDNGNPVVHKFENSAWSSSNYIDANFASKSEVSFPTIPTPASTTLNDDVKSLIINKGALIDNFMDYTQITFFPARQVFGGGRILGKFIGMSANARIVEGYYGFNNNSNQIYNYATFAEYIQGTGTYNLQLEGNAKLAIGNRAIPSLPTNNPTPVYLQLGTNKANFTWIDPFNPTSVSLTDGGTINDTTLQENIENHRPIILNGFTCYFSCDDGTNYQYVSTRYDGSANKNHINVITINKSTWVATFHKSDLALS